MEHCCGKDYLAMLNSYELFTFRETDVFASASLVFFNGGV